MHSPSGATGPLTACHQLAPVAPLPASMLSSSARWRGAFKQHGASCRSQRVEQKHAQPRAGHLAHWHLCFLWNDMCVSLPHTHMCAHTQLLLPACTLTCAPPHTHAHPQPLTDTARALTWPQYCRTKSTSWKGMPSAAHTAAAARASASTHVSWPGERSSGRAPVPAPAATAGACALAPGTRAPEEGIAVRGIAPEAGPPVAGRDRQAAPVLCTARCPPLAELARAPPASPPSSRGSQLRMNTPNTSWPARFSSSAATAESTPPDTATATRSRWPRAARTQAGRAQRVLPRLPASLTPSSPQLLLLLLPPSSHEHRHPHSC